MRGFFSPSARRLGGILAVAVFVCLVQAPALAVETDQFLTWEIELEDSADAINAFFNAEVQGILDKRNSAIENDCACPKLAKGIFRHFFKRRRTSVIKVFMRQSDDVEMYPGDGISNIGYRKISIFRTPAFPFVIPMARTVRVGDVYFGVDKIGHMFGFGSRYYQRYLGHIRTGATEGEAIEKVVRWGIMFEQIFVGQYLDGIFSHGDMEANYQGFMLSRDLCEGDDPFLVRDDAGDWKLTHPIDLRTYITPDFDESYNLSHFWGMRKRDVLQILREDYSHMLGSEMVQERFRNYAQRPPSLSKKLIQAYYDEKGKQPQIEQSISVFNVPPASAVGFASTLR